MDKIKVVIVDDDKDLCEALETILTAATDITVLASGHCGLDAIRLYGEYHPDVMLMDIRMEPMSGLQAGEQILLNNPEAKLLYLTTFLDDEYIIRALNLGAKGYLIKQDIAGIAPALQAVHSGQTVFGGEVSKIAFRQARGYLEATARPTTAEVAGQYQISERELDVIEYIAKGKSNKEIAAGLVLSEGTVRNYISNILDKLLLRDRTQIAIFYFQNLT